MDNFIIKAEHLGYSYAEAQNTASSVSDMALNDINFTVRRGEYLAILGHNGSGKSTLAKLLNLIKLMV